MNTSVHTIARYQKSEAFTRLSFDQSPRITS